MEDRIEIIHEMIEKTRRRAAGSGGYFLLWGWLILFACIAQYALEYLHAAQYSWVLWSGVTAFGAIITVLMQSRNREKSGVTTYVDSAISSVWQACGISILLVAFVGVMFGGISYDSLVPTISILAGIATFVTGRVIEYRVMQYAGIIWGVGAVVAMFMPAQYHTLIMGVTIIPGYLVPGYAIKRYAGESHEAV